MNLKKKIIMKMKKKVNGDVNFFFSTYYIFLLCYKYKGDKMKKIIRSIFMPILMAILLGFILGRYVYRTYRSSVYDTLSSSRLYLVSNGEYDSIVDMREENINNNYVYYKDDDKYKSVIGITKDYDNIEKIKSLYDDNLSVLEYYVASDILDNKQDEYDKLLSNTNNTDEVKKTVNDILNLYRKDDKIKLISIN